MSNIKDIVPFVDFSLNSDDAHRYMPKGSSDYFLNVLKGEDGSYGELTNLKGNRKVTYPLGDSNAYFVLSSCYDGLTRNVYFFIFSQPFDVSGSGDYEYDNRLVRFNEDSEVIDTIFYDTKNYFGLNPTRLFKDAFVLGDWLYFNPIESEPKVVHLTMALNYTKALKNLENHSFYDDTLTYLYGDKVAYFGGIFVANTSVAVGENPVSNYAKWDRIGDCYQGSSDIGFDSEFRYAFNVIKHIPVYRPTCIYASDLDKNANNVRGKLFRFSHRYKYFDNSFSRYSAFSDITLPQYDEYFNGEVPGDLDQFNYIQVKISLHSAALVKEIDIIFQESGGDWRRAKIINRRDISLLDASDYTYKFYNTDSAYEVIDDTAFNEAYDSVPKKANAQEIINKNILCYGGCTEGFTDLDKNDIDVILTPEIEAITIPNSTDTTVRYRDNLTQLFDWVLVPTMVEVNPAPGSIYTGPYDWYFQPGLWLSTEGWTTGDVFLIKISGKEVRYVLQAGDTASIAAFCTAIGNFLKTSFPTLAPVIYISSLSVRLTNMDASFRIDKSIFYTLSGITTSALTKATGFKTGAWHPFCIFYYDTAMRRWDAQTSKDSEDGVAAWSADGTTVYVPMLGEYSPTPSTTANKWNINWSVNHLPPEGAKWWRWGYAGNALASKFVQYIIENIQDDVTLNLTKLDITPLQIVKGDISEPSWNSFPQSVITPYSWTKGDRVRIITQAATASELGVVIDGVYDFEILKYDDTVANEYWIYTQDFDYAAIGVGVETLIEIYTPIKSDTARTFFEFGELMPIIEDSDGVLVHGVGVTGLQNQDTLLAEPALGVFTSGDVYHILRTPSKPINVFEGYFHESQWYSDFYDSDDWDKGRIGVETQFGERKLNIVRHSNQFLQNTMINGLPTFHGGDYKELNDVFGDIMRIIEIGDTLKVYQRKKPSSILIGRTEYTDAAGNSNIVQISDRVFGSIRYSSTNYGTEFAESIERNNRYVYGFDVYNGVLWRDSPNGIFPVSGRYESADGGGDYKMETYFKQKSKDLLVSGIAGIDVMTVWDERHKNLYVIFKDAVNEANDEAIIFHEPSNRWICFTNMDQTPAEGWNQMLELDWYILRGFDAGLGIYFNEDTRFIEFTMETTANAMASPSIHNVQYIQFTPSVTIFSDAAISNIELKILPIKPDVTVHFVHALDVGLSFTGDEYGYSANKLTFVQCSPDPCIISSISDASWFTITDTLGTPLSVGSAIYNNGGIYIYPNSINIGAQRQSVITFVGYTAFETDTLVITQTQTTQPPPIGSLDVYGDSLLVLSLEDDSVSVSVSSLIASLVFTPNCVTYNAGQIFPIRWYAYLNGISVATGTVSVTNLWPNNIDITLPGYLYSGDSLIVFLSSITTQDLSPVLTVNNFQYNIYTPSVLITKVDSTVTDMNWIAADFGIANKIDAVITATGVDAYISYMPPWIRVMDALGDPIIDWISYIGDGDTISVYPDEANTGLERTSEIRIVNGQGATVSITITQAAVIIPGETPVVSYIVVAASDTYLTIPNWGSHATDATSTVLMEITSHYPFLDEGESLQLSWRAFLYGDDSPLGNGNFIVLNDIETSVEIQLSRTPVIDEIIRIELSSF